jgi:hypothetical protein
MRSKRASITLLSAALAIACQPAGQSGADTTVSTSSSTIQTVGGASVMDTSAATGVVSGKTSTGSKTTKTVSSTGKSGSQVKSTPVNDPTIRGRDSVIRFPLKKLPTATSTPTRE